MPGTNTANTKCFMSVVEHLPDDRIIIKSSSMSINALLQPKVIEGVNPPMCNTLSTDGRCGPFATNGKICPFNFCGVDFRCTHLFYHQNRQYDLKQENFCCFCGSCSEEKEKVMIIRLK